MMVTDSSALMLDEISTGLDSQTIFDIIKVPVRVKSSNSKPIHHRLLRGTTTKPTPNAIFGVIKVPTL
jgi:hypothetical protein